MTENGISRRQVLRAASVAGGLGIASGAGTSALLGDEESFGGGFGGGTLDLQVTHEELTWSNPCKWNPSFDEEGTSAGRIPLTGGSHYQTWGILGIALTVCDNSGRVTLELERNEGDDDHPSWPHHRSKKRGDSTFDPVDEEQDGNLSKKPDGPDEERTNPEVPGEKPNEKGNLDEKPKRPGDPHEQPKKPASLDGKKPGNVHDVRSMGGGFEPQVGFPVHEPYVELRAGTCKGTLLADGSLSSVVASLEGGIPLETGCTYLGKLETHDEGESFTAENGTVDGEDTFVFDRDGESVTVEITGRDYKDDERAVNGVDLAVDGAKLCRVQVKGGGGYETFSPDCEGTVSVVAGDTRGGQGSAISHLKLFVCGEEKPCIPCAPEDPFKLFLYWVGGLTRENLDLVFSAEQCRHAGDGGSR